MRSVSLVSSNISSNAERGERAEVIIIALEHGGKIQMTDLHYTGLCAGADSGVVRINLSTVP